MKRVIHSSTDTPSTLYHRSNLDIVGWDSSKILDLGLHCSESIDARNHTKHLYAVHLNMSMLKYAEVPDIGNWATLDGLISLMKYIDPLWERDDIVAWWRSVWISGNRNKASNEIASMLLDRYGLNALKYVDSVDGEHDNCYCLLNPSPIIEIEKLY